MSNELKAAFEAWKQGQFDVAAQACRAAIVADQRNAEAYNLLGAINGRVGDHAAAVESFKAAAALVPADTEYCKNLCRAYLQAGNHEAAEATLREALATKPNDQLQGLLGVVFAMNDRIAEALEATTAAIELNPNNAAHHFALSELQRRSGDRPAAIASLRKVLQLQPGNVDALNNLAGLEVSEGHFMDALKNIQHLLEINPRSAQAYCNLAALLSLAGDLRQAVVSLRNALQLQPDLIRARVDLAEALVLTGELDEAQAIGQSLYNSAPWRVAAIGILAKVFEKKKEVQKAYDVLMELRDDKRQQPNIAVIMAVVLEQLDRKEEAIEVLQSSMQNYQTAASQGIGIYFVLGDLFDALKRYDEAFEAYRSGNKNRKKAFVEIAGKPETERKQIDVIKELHPKDTYAEICAAECDSEKPIFIVGMPRSGTTLTEQILASHPQVYGAGELTIVQDAVSATYGQSQSRPGMLTINASDQNAQRRTLVPQGWPVVSQQAMNQLAQSCLTTLSAISPESPRITDKLPYNFFLVGSIRKIFPHSTIIHCTRHPLDTCLSCFFQNFSTGNEFSFDLEQLGIFYRDYYEIMRYWRELEIPMFDVCYEDLVSDPEPNVRALLEHCNLDWDERCLAFHKHKRTVNTASYQQVRRPMYQSSRGRWRNYRQQLQPVIEQIPDLIDDLS